MPAFSLNRCPPATCPTSACRPGFLLGAGASARLFCLVGRLHLHLFPGEALARCPPTALLAAVCQLADSVSLLPPTLRCNVGSCNRQLTATLLCAPDPRLPPNDLQITKQCHNFIQGVELGLLAAISLSLLLLIFESAFPRTATLGRIPKTTAYRSLEVGIDIELRGAGRSRSLQPAHALQAAGGL